MIKNSVTANLFLSGVRRIELRETNPYKKTAFYKALGMKIPGVKPDDLSMIDQLRWSTWESGDGIAGIPETPKGMTLGDFLQRQIEECRGRLQAMNIDIGYDIQLNSDHYRYRCGRGIQVAQFQAKGNTTGERLVHFDLGGHLVGRSTDYFCEMLARNSPTGIMLLEPAGALSLITRWLDCVRRNDGGTLEGLPTMHIECGGAVYSPSRFGKFDNVPRWDFYAPMKDKQGLLFLNSDWSGRARPAQGVAIATPVHSNI